MLDAGTVGSPKWMSPRLPNRGLILSIDPNPNEVPWTTPGTIAIRWDPKLRGKIRNLLAVLTALLAYSDSPTASRASARLL
jgi:hypothetical protein